MQHMTCLSSFTTKQKKSKSIIVPIVVLKKNPKMKFARFVSMTMTNENLRKTSKNAL